jgi:hypothetical protein
MIVLGVFALFWILKAKEDASKVASTALLSSCLFLLAFVTVVLR